MLFSELYLAYKLAKSKEYQIILLDRYLSGTLSSLMYDTSKRALWKRQCAICTVDIDNAKLDDIELAYERYHLPDPGGSLPARGDYLRYATILLLEKTAKPLTVAEIAGRLNCTADDRLRRLSRYLKQTVDAGFLQASDDKYRINPRHADSWSRIRQLVDLFGIRFFTSSTGNPLQIRNGDQTRPGLGV